MNKTIILFIFVAVIAIGILGSANIMKPEKGPPPSFQGINWYPIEPWEAEACSKWGGYEVPIASQSPSLLAEGRPLTVTMQGRSYPFANDKFGYEVSYYVEPMQANVSFKIVLKGEATKTILEPTRAMPGGISDTIAVALPERYTTAVMEFIKPDNLKPFEVPLVTQE